MAETGNKLDKNQKLALAGLTLFAVTLVAVWFLKISNEISGPLAFRPSPSDIAASTSDQTEEYKLQHQDTDGDGLSDWDEINIYHTSPYLADSDSDGIPDGVEVKNGTNPNCPEGHDCGAASAIVASGTIPAVGQPAGKSGGLASSSQGDLINLLSGVSDAATLRKLLIQGGVDKASLDKIPDADLVKKYQEMIASSSRSQ